MPSSNTRRSRKERPIWAEAIRKRRLQLDLRQEDVQDASNDAIDQSTVSNIELGKLEPLDVSAQRLGGLLKGLRWTPEQFTNATGIELPGFASEVVGPVEMTHSKRVAPVYTGVSGGPGLDGGQVIDYVSIPEEWPDGEYVAFDIEGDSMKPTIPNGSRVKVRVQSDVLPGQIVVFWASECNMCIKEYSGMTPDGYHVFRAHNPDLPPEHRTLYFREIHIKGYVMSHEVMHHVPKRSRAN